MSVDDFILALAKLGAQRAKLVVSVQRVSGGFDPGDLVSGAILSLAERLANGMPLQDELKVCTVRSAKKLRLLPDCGGCRADLKHFRSVTGRMRW